MVDNEKEKQNEESKDNGEININEEKEEKFIKEEIEKG